MESESLIDLLISQIKTPVHFDEQTAALNHAARRHSLNPLFHANSKNSKKDVYVFIKNNFS